MANSLRSKLVNGNRIPEPGETRVTRRCQPRRLAIVRPASGLAFMAESGKQRYLAPMILQNVEILGRFVSRAGRRWL